MKNYFEEIGFSKEVPNCVLSNTIKAWSNFNINIRPATNNEYIVLNTSNTENYIQFELLVGINLYSVRFDGTLDIYRASNKLRSYDHIPVDAAMYILAEMISRASIYRKIIGNKCKITNSKFYGKVPVLLVGWLADLVCWKDKSYTLSEANIGEAFKLDTDDTTIIIKFVSNGTKYRFFYDIEDNYDNIILRANGRKIDVIDIDLANMLVIKLSECFKKLVNEANKAGIIYEV